MGKHDTGRCEFCGQEETVEHVILYCQKYESESQNLEKIKIKFIQRYILQNNLEKLML